MILLAGRVGAQMPGGVLAFVSEQGRSADIYLLDVRAGILYPIIQNPGLDWSPAWSPDGQALVFSSNGDLYALDIFTRQSTRLTENRGSAWPSWSPDGRFIAFAAKPDGEPVYDLYIMNADGTGARRVMRGSETSMRPVWSPDGRELLFHAGDGPTQVYRLLLDRMTAEPVSASLPDAGWASWSPDGEWIAAQGFSGGNRELFLLDPAGERHHRLTTTVEDEGVPAWSPDGQQIVFYAGAEGSYDLYIIDRDGTNRRRLIALEGDEMFPVWQPR